MSHTALCLAVRDRIRSQLGYAARDCEVMGPGGNPPAKCGLFFVAVWAGNARNHDRNAIKRSYAVNVTITARTRKPEDQTGLTEIGVPTTQATGPGLPPFFGELVPQVGPGLLPGTSFLDRIEALADCIGKDTYDFHVCGAANVYLGDQTMQSDGFRQGLWWVDYTEARIVGPEWFWSEPGKGAAGIVADLHFEGAVRNKSFGNIPG